MPANLTPQYHKAEQAFKEAKTTEDKIAALEEMLAVIPKHKGTDHLQADLRRRLSKLKDEATKPKGGKKAFDPFRVEKGGAGQVLLLGPPNAGKSAIVARLSNAPTEPTPFPFATQGPIPGMMAFEDIKVQLVDLPPITAEHFPKGMMGLVKGSDGLLFVADLGSESVLEDLEAVLHHVEEGRVEVRDPAMGRGGPPTAPSTERGVEAGSQRGKDGSPGGKEGSSGPKDEPQPGRSETVTLSQRRGGEPPAVEAPPEEERRSFLIVRLPAMLIANKVDLPGARDKLAILRELYQGRFEPVAVSTVTGEGLDDFAQRVFRMLDRIRVYSKEPGKPADMGAPFVLRRGETVLDLAARIHRDFPEHLKQARVWGSARFEGQAVQKDYVLVDKDVVELQVNL